MKRKRPYDCEKHKVDFEGYGDAGSCCDFCIFDTADALLPTADKIMGWIKKRISQDEWDTLEASAEKSKLNMSFHYSMMIIVGCALHLLRNSEKIPDMELNEQIIYANERPFIDMINRENV